MSLTLKTFVSTDGLALDHGREYGSMLLISVVVKISVSAGYVEVAGLGPVSCGQSESQVKYVASSTQVGLS